MITTILLIIVIVGRLCKWYYTKKFGVLTWIIPVIVVWYDKLVSKVFGIKPEVKSVDEFYTKMNKGGNRL